jgi:hypothetical protein
MKILKKEWFIWKFWKKGGGSREKGGGGNEIHAPCACVVDLLSSYHAATGVALNIFFKLVFQVPFPLIIVLL